MRFSGYLYFATSVFVFVFLFSIFINSSVMAVEPQDETAINKNKKEILSDIELFEQSLYKTKSCISEAKTAADLEKCRMDETALRFQAVQDLLNEIGMPRREKRLYELRPEK